MGASFYLQLFGCVNDTQLRSCVSRGVTRLAAVGYGETIDVEQQMAVFGATDLGPHSATREPLLGWLARNVLRLAIYLLAASLAAALYSVAADETGSLAVPGLTVYFAFVGGFLGIPGAIGWLLIVAALPPEWSTLRRRAVAVALSPLIQVTLLVFLFSRGYVWAAAMVGLLLPAGSAFVVRLRVGTPSALWRPEDPAR